MTISESTDWDVHELAENDRGPTYGHLMTGACSVLVASDEVSLSNYHGPFDDICHDCMSSFEKIGVRYDVHDYVQGLKSCDHFHAFWTIVEHYSMEDLEGVRILNCVSEVRHVVQLRKISFCEHVFRG